MHKIFFLQVIFFMSVFLTAQNTLPWDKTEKCDWPEAFKEVEISSSVDDAVQKAYMYGTSSNIAKPLIVSLHTWSGDYTQEDPLTKEILARNWNYIHPDFRGPNHRPEATGSDLVISDISDAINYALENTNSNPDEVHIVGVSGGGYATLAAYMKLEYPVKSFSAWAPISDLESWYWESLGRKQKYALDILNSVSMDSLFNRIEARKRSPLHQEFPYELRKNSHLFIYEGIHDGYDGSVPVTQSVNMYNRLVGEQKFGLTNHDSIAAVAGFDNDMVSQKEIIDLVTKRYIPEMIDKVHLFDRNVWLKRKHENIELVIFEGDHEQLPQALGLIPVDNITNLEYNILTIGDSNGEIERGWVNQLRNMMPESNIVNISKSGLTIGFDNLGRKDLNALRNIDHYLDEAQDKIGKEKYDFVIVCLGTNDTKKIFENRQDEVLENFRKLLARIREHKLIQKSNPQLVFVTPPPMRTYNILDKYQGGNDRLNKLMPRFTEIAEKNGFEVVDVYHPLLGVMDYYAKDGIHMAAEGQEIVAARILDHIR
jgi:lysophospholipase L1-like esterase/pimeloyl-ACP methyl ester carboxylesterase